MAEDLPAPDPFRAELAKLVRSLLDEAHVEDHPISERLVAHLGVDVSDLPIHGEVLPSYELANVQVGIDALVAQQGFELEVLGIAGQGRRFSDVSLADLLSASQFAAGPPEYVHAPVGPGRTLACLSWAILLATGTDGPLVVFVRRGEDNGPTPGITIQAVAPNPDAAPRFLAELRRLREEHDVFRGQVITIEADRRGNRHIVFLERPQLARDDLILPAGVLERIERHVIEPSRHRDELMALGRHLGRGLLLWGPPGTGKTHTVRYLTKVRDDATVIILSGASLGMVGAFGTLARRLAPAVVVLEDVDLVAQERTHGPFGSSPVLFELMNEMSGLAADADIAFVLTTNRPDTLEPALAARPGRIDLAIEIPLPDAVARRGLLELYARGLEVDVPALDRAVARTEGMTASFFKELLRKAALAALAEGRRSVTGESLDAALDELLDENAAMTRALLSGDGGSEAAPQHAWLRQGWAAATSQVTFRQGP